MKAFFAACSLAILCVVRPAAAQEEVVWVQIEAHRDLGTAQAAAARYAEDLPDIAGFSVQGGWFGVMVGPYTRRDAEQVLRVYRNERQIPRDSFLQITNRLQQQFWPEGEDVLGRGPIQPSISTPTPTAPVAQADPVEETPAPEPFVADETPAQARQSESRLTRQEREALQIALRWAGLYNAAIDGAFGRGTRSSMSAWQDNKGYDVTGVLTTAQRAELLAEYNAPLTSVGMAMVRDSDAGIDMVLPMGEVAFEKYEPPFAHYNSAGDLGIRVLLISQPGDQNTLFGLYEIMQTLEIVPLDGPRERRSDSFTLEGRNDRFISYTEAALDDGEIKGFTLIWPVGDDPRRDRVLSEMKASFQRTQGVLDPAAGDGGQQDIDLISGLEVRKPRLSRSGFFVDTQGTVITTAEVTDSCTRITLEGEIPVDVIASDPALGVTVLRPGTPVAPISVARFRASQPRLQSDVAVAGFSFEGALGAPSLTFGTLSDVKGLRGETELKRLALASLPGDAGGPVLDTRGSVLGMLLPRAKNGPQLPLDVSFAANGQAINNVLAEAGLAVDSADADAAMTPVELNRIASGMTVLVSCWD